MLGSMLKTRLIHHHPGGIFHAVLSWNNLRMLKMAVQQGRRQVETGGVPFLTRPPQAARTACSPSGVR